MLSGLVGTSDALTQYGVALKDGRVDEAGTERYRAELRRARFRLRVRSDETEAYEGIKGRHRVVRLAPDVLDRLGAAEGDLLELRGRHPVPLRGWTRCDETARDLPLDEFARRALGVASGDEVEIRRLASAARIS